MPRDVLAEGSEWLNGMRREFRSREVTYRSGDVSETCLATVSATTFETHSEMGVIDRWESRDFVIATEDLPVATPRRGDIISETIGTATVRYEVCAPQGAPTWKWVGTSRRAVRVHTKAMGS
jgi:hypothetical protein